MLNLYMVEKNGQYIALADRIEIYIPEYYFDKTYAEDFGGSIKTFGVLPVRIYKGDKLINQTILNLPSMIELYPKSQDKISSAVLGDHWPQYDYRIAKFYKGEIIMPSSIVSNSDNVENFLKMLMGGKIPAYVPYHKLVYLWMTNMELNSTGLNVPIGILGIIISSIYRDKQNPIQRYVDAWKIDPNKHPLDYTTASMRDIAARSSTFAAITFEDQDAMITTALNNAKYNRKEKMSPIEKIIKM